MKINYVPGLALRFYPGLSRELYDAVDTYVATGCKIAIFTGTAPDETAIWNLTNFNDYVTANAANLVYQETTQLQFSYDGFKHKRVIQRYPIDSTPITALIAPVAQNLLDHPAAIETANSLYALVYCPDKDTTLNTAGNDLVLFIPGVGSTSTDFCSLSKTNFTAGESIYFRNLTISLFQGYQITDTLVTEQQEDPENPGQYLPVAVDSKKSVYLNKVWGNRISEAYRDCFVSRTATAMKFDIYSGTTNTHNRSTLSNLCPPSYFQDMMVADFASPDRGQLIVPRKFNPATGQWTNEWLLSEFNKTIYNGYLVNQSMINLLDEINAKGALGQFSKFTDLVRMISSPISGVTPTEPYRFYVCAPQSGAVIYSPNNYIVPTNTGSYLSYPNYENLDIITGTLAKFALFSHMGPNIKVAVRQVLIEQGLDEGTIDSALKSVVPIDFDITKYSSSYDKDQNILTIQNGTPAKLKSRYKKTINNPTNEQLYILVPRFLNRSAIENPFNMLIAGPHDMLTSISSVSYPATSKVLDGEIVDNSTKRIRQQDYTAVSIGLSGNGNTDLEYDLLDVIDYIDSFTAMIKVPNKF